MPLTPEELDPYVSVADLRVARTMYGGYCMGGLKTMAEHHGIDLKTFLKGQVRVSTLEATNDALVQRIARITRERTGT